ncbi:MAG: STAS/SEC14 domain-containing protein [Gammaproteobacteria bacterium]|nr:STAS/SEC14 domain-containing protein [Gammaproteobacteria bacterium]
MLELLDGLSDAVIGVKATGEVTADDYRNVLVPALEERLERHKHVRLLYVLGSEFEGFTGGAAWEDSKVGMRHFTAFDRIAVVSDLDWVQRMVKALGFVVPGEVRVYDEGGLEQARTWISAPPSPGKLQFELDEEKRLLVLEPKDQLEALDFANVAQEIDPFIERVGSLNGLVVVAEEFPGWDDFAAFTAHFRFVREHHDRIRRIALVTSSRYLAALPRLASHFVEAEVRHFPWHQRAAAIAWAAAGEQ